MLVRQLTPNTLPRLRSPLIDDPKATPKIVIDVTKLPLEDLVESMRQLPRIRARQGLWFSEPRLLALTTCALLSGVTGYRDLTRYAKKMQPYDLQRLGLR